MAEWRPIKGFDSRYLISSDGAIVSNNYKCSGKSAELKPARDKKGYLRTMLLDDAGKYRTVKVHRLVANAFIDNPNDLPQVNHINGIKTDNRASNLEWVTNLENATHAIKNGLFANSMAATRAENLKRQIAVIVTNIDTGERTRYASMSDARRATGCAKISAILRGDKRGYKNFRFERG